MPGRLSDNNFRPVFLERRATWGEVQARHVEAIENSSSPERNLRRLIKKKAI